MNTVQVRSEANASAHITILTMMSALRNIAHGENSSGSVEETVGVAVSDAAGALAAGILEGSAGACIAEGAWAGVCAGAICAAAGDCAGATAGCCADAAEASTTNDSAAIDLRMVLNINALSPADAQSLGWLSQPFKAPSPHHQTKGLEARWSGARN